MKLHAAILIRLLPFLLVMAGMFGPSSSFADAPGPEPETSSGFTLDAPTPLIQEDIMTWEQMKALLTGKGVEVSADAEAALQQEIEKEEKEKEKTSTKVEPTVVTRTTQTNTTDSQELTQLRAEFAELKEMNTGLVEMLKEEKKAREDSRKTVEQQLAATRTKEIADLIAAAVEAGKITPEQKPVWEQRLTTSYEISKEVLDELQGTKSSKQTAGAKTTNGSAAGAGASSGGQDTVSRLGRGVDKSIMDHVRASVEDSDTA